MEIINVQNDWTWSVDHAKNLMMEDKQLQEDVLKIAKKYKLEVNTIIELYSEGLKNGISDGKFLSFDKWFYKVFKEF